MRNMIRVLYVGDSEVVHSIAIKGFDSFTSSVFVDDSHILVNALQTDKDIIVSHMQTHEAFNRFPTSEKELAKYNVVILSDVGSNTLLLNSGFFAPFKVPLGPNRLGAIRDYVQKGGALIMCGGYLSFSGLNATAKYHGTPVEEVLPVDVLEIDDRVEIPEGFKFNVTKPNHPIMRGIPWEEGKFLLLGYNRLKLKNGATLLANHQNDPIIAVWEYEKGRSMIFASDCALHWVGNFHEWKHYSHFWTQAIKWLTTSE